MPQRGPAWSALAERFAIVASESSIEYRDFHPVETHNLSTEMIRSRVLFRYWPDASREDERVISTRADGELPMLRMARANRFRWLCWAAGVLLDPNLPYQPPEVAWLLDVTGGQSEGIIDIARLSEQQASRYARDDRDPAPVLPVSRPASWWEGRTATFARIRERFAAPLFHGTLLRVTIGQRHRNSLDDERRV